jgi:hypothetical protein
MKNADRVRAAQSPQDTSSPQAKEMRFVCAMMAMHARLGCGGVVSTDLLVAMSFEIADAMIAKAAL